ncbi:MAG: class D sortase, partial [Acidimicrobiales bacterium]
PRRLALTALGIALTWGALAGLGPLRRNGEPPFRRVRAPGSPPFPLWLGTGPGGPSRERCQLGGGALRVAGPGSRSGARRCVMGAGSGTRRARAPRRLALTALGIALTWGALAGLGYMGGWELHAHRANRALLDAEQSIVHHTRGAQQTRRAPAACVVGAPRAGQLAGILEIPAVHLTAPVEEGTSDAVLAVAVGHDPSSVWPGANGTAAFLAHDVSYFVNLGALKPGDAVLYRTACSTTRFTVSRSQVVVQGTPLPDTRAASLVLDTCYPSNALFFTSHRLLVWATEVQGHRSGRTTQSPGEIRAPGLDDVSYEVAAPAALVAQGLTLQQNEAPMGTMTLQGATSPAWAQSPGPLALEAAALEAYFGGLHAAAEGQSAWWHAISLPGVATPAWLRGAEVGESDAPLDVEIVSAHDLPTEVVLTTVITLSGGSAPGVYAETVTTAVRGSEVALSSWSLRPVST